MTINWQRLDQLTPQDIADALSVPVQAVQLVWDALNPTRRLTELRAQYVAQVWDGTSPLNGWTADEVRDTFTPPRYGQIVYVYRADDGKILDLQPTMPGTGDPIPKLQAQDVANSIADQRALADATTTLYGEALEYLRQRAAELIQQFNPEASLEDVNDYLTRLLSGAGGEEASDGSGN